MSDSISRIRYAMMYGPTKGDSIRLGDTCLYAQVEEDMTVYAGDEVKFGGGKTIQDGRPSIVRAVGMTEFSICDNQCSDFGCKRHPESRYRHPGRKIAESERPEIRISWME